MTPEFLPGDRLLVDVTAFRSRPPAAGQVVVLRDPEDGRRFLLKRVAAREGEPVPGPLPPGDDLRVPAGHLYLLSDQRAGGRDSRRFGAVPLGSIVGLAWFRYAPSPRRGPLPP